MINKAILVGNLGADPEVRYTQSGTQVTTFNVATTERWKGQDGQMQESTEWHRVVAWNRLAEICGEYLSKGSKVYIEGKIQTRKWQDQNGNDRYSTEIVAKEMKMLSPKGGDGGQGGFSNTEPPMPPEPEWSTGSGTGGSGTGEDVPF